MSITRCSFVPSPQTNPSFSAPTMCVGGWHLMSTTCTWSRQPVRIAWSNKHLQYKCAISLSHAIGHSKSITYTSHLQSYLSFCKLHNCPTNLTNDTLSFYVVFMCHHINPHSVNVYLSGICNTLEPHFPDI